MRTEHLDALLESIPEDMDESEQAERLQEHLFGASSELAWLKEALSDKKMLCPSCYHSLSSQDGYWYCTNIECGQSPESDEEDDE